MSKRKQAQTQPPSASPTIYADITAIHREIGIVSTVDGDYFRLPFNAPIPQGRRVRIMIVDAEDDNAEESGAGTAGDHAGVSASA